MSAESLASSHRSLVRRHLVEMWNAGDLAAAATFCHADVVQHDPFNRRLTDRDAYVRHVRDIRRAFPDLEIAVRDILAEGDRVAVRWTAEGTHRGAIGGLPPTGGRVAFGGMSVYRLLEGRIAEIWTTWDTVGYLRQLDALPGRVAARG